MNTRYTDLDNAICAHVGSGSATHPIYARTLLAAATASLGGDAVETDKQVWRLIDRRLQALRKAGRLRLERRRWVLASV